MRIEGCFRPFLFHQGLAEMSGPILSTANTFVVWTDGWLQLCIHPTLLNHRAMPICTLESVQPFFGVRRKLIFYRPSPNYCKCLFQGLDMIHSSQFCEITITIRKKWMKIWKSPLHIPRLPLLLVETTELHLHSSPFPVSFRFEKDAPLLPIA